jgi:hypothetical protein
MAGVGRNLWLAAAMAGVLAAAAMLLPSALWTCLVAALLGLTGVVLFRGNRWRNGALLLGAVALGLALLDGFAGLLTPAPMGQGLVRTTDPRWWPPPDPIMGFRPLPNSEVVATASWDGETIYRRTYHFDGEAARVTPAAPANADTYLFLGDSFTFGQGLLDEEAVAAQFAKANDYKVRAVNLGVPGYGPNHLLRLFDSGLLERYAKQPVKAVVTWIIPAQLARVTGDGSWLGSSPRYVLENGVLRHTGSFNEYRLFNPIAGARYLLGEQFAFIDAIGRKQRQDEQIELFVAIMTRLQQYAREKFNAPLIVIYSWPDEHAKEGAWGGSVVTQPELVSVLSRLRRAGMQLIAVDRLTWMYDVSKILIPHDGHPNAFSNELIAGELKKRLTGS